MSGSGGGSKVTLILVALAGLVIGYFINSVLTSSSTEEHDKIASMENTIKTLEVSLAQKEQELKNANRLEAQPAQELSKPTVANGTITQSKQSPIYSDQPVANATPSSVDILKSLETVSANDPRPYTDKLKELLSSDVSKDKIAIASRSIFDMARDRQSLPDYALQSIYNSHSDPNLKRVIAQVLSQRGNNSLLENQISEAQVQLKSQDPKDRQEALNQLAKIHSTKAVEAITPYLLDPDTNVKLEALQALRNTGNQKNISMVEMLVNDPDPSVSSLASDVLANLRNLSSSARNTPSRSDIESELPPMQ